ncbi:MAG TPA: hypothetical protein DIU02_04850 [Subdoligranulum sp.]|nr:hypothetical protein [Subdoligranulum sp.]
MGVVQVKNYVNVRKRPSENAKIVGKMTNNSGCHVYKIKKGWAKIVSGGVRGFVKASYLITDEKAEAKAQKVATLRATVTTETLNVRYLPSTKANVFDQISADEDYKITRETLTKGWLDEYIRKNVKKSQLKGIDKEKMYADLNNWVMIAIDDDRAFVSKDFIKMTYNLNRAVSIKEVGQSKKSGKKGGSGKGGNGKKKKKIRWWQILLITLLVIALIFGGAFALIMGAIAPEGGSIKLDQLINTPKEFQGKEMNFLMIGIDRSTQKEGDDLNDAGVDDGNTDMILYVHFNNETGEMKMLQIPRDTMVTTDRSVSGNYRINNIAKTQAADSDSMNMAALCEQISNMYQLPLDGYMTIRLEMLVQLVDTFGGIELYVPQEMDYKGSHLDQGYQTLNGDACEFLLRTRHIYPDGDIGRLNMQRQFYSALFRRLKSIGNIWDVAKLTPAVLNYMETSLSASQLVSFAVSMLKIDSSKIMICQMPIKMAGKYNGQAVVYPARQEDADILNQYFRENTGFVDASELQLCDDASVLGFDLSGYTATDANVQYMGQLNQEAADAQQNQNLDGSHTVEYVDSESTDTADSSSDSTEAESQPAA